MRRNKAEKPGVRVCAEGHQLGMSEEWTRSSMAGAHREEHCIEIEEVDKIGSCGPR